MLTYSSMARARLRHARKEYWGLIIGVFLSLFLAATACLSIQGVYLAQMQKIRQTIGSWTAYLLDWADCSDQELREMELFDQIGHVYVQARMTDMDIYLGYSDETAGSLFPRRVLEGRLPESSGEIALEQGALIAAGGDASWHLGDTVSLNLTPVDGLAEQREFTLVGILADQAAELQPKFHIGSPEDNILVSSFPAGLLSPEEQFPTGRLAVHRIMDSLPGVSQQELYRRITNTGDEQDLYSTFFLRLILLSDTGIIFQVSAYEYNEGSPRIDQNLLRLFIILTLLFLSLILCCCVGIAGSMEGILEKRKEEIGILRCLGATRRQIRRMFGREALLLAALLAPISIAAGCASAAVMAHFFPDAFIFRANPWLLIPIGLLGVGAILLCQSLPLLRASRQMPMGVMRDVTMLRRAKGLRSRKQFRLPRLLTRRMLRLYPARPLGAALLAGLTFLCTALLGALISKGLPILSPQKPAFTISTQSSGWWISSNNISWVPWDGSLSSGSLAQLRSLPHVTGLSLQQHIRVMALVPEVPAFYTRFGRFSGGNTGLLSWEEYQRQFPDLPRFVWENAQKDYLELKERYEISGEAIQMQLIALDPESSSMRQLQSSPHQGKIDLEALNKGSQVLIYFPSFWGRIDENGNLDFQLEGASPRNPEMEKIVTPDCFYPGQTLPILQLYSTNPDFYSMDYGSPQWVTRRDAAVTVGSLVTEQIEGLPWIGGCIVTTTSGLQNMGLVPNGQDTIKLYVDQIPDESQAKALARKVEAIALRAKESTVMDYISQARESARYQLQVLTLFSCLVALFFTLSTSNLLTGVSRQIMADGQRLGMLRAVGADEKTLLGCYSGQIAIAILGGVFLGVLGIAAIDLSDYLRWNSAPTFLPTAWTILPVAALNWVLCRLLLGRKIRALTRQSVILTIREL